MKNKDFLAIMKSHIFLFLKTVILTSIPRFSSLDFTASAVDT